MREFFVRVFRKQKNCGDENCPLFKVRSEELTSGNCSFPARTVLKHDVVAKHRWAFAINTQQPRVRNWALTVFSDDLLSIVSLVTGGPNTRPSWVDWIKNNYAVTISYRNIIAFWPKTFLINFRLSCLAILSLISHHYWKPSFPKFHLHK